MINDYERDPGIVPLPTFLDFTPDDTERQQLLTDQEEEEIDTLAAGLEKSASE